MNDYQKGLAERRARISRYARESLLQQPIGAASQTRTVLVLSKAEAMSTSTAAITMKGYSDPIRCEPHALGRSVLFGKETSTMSRKR